MKHGRALRPLTAIEGSIGGHCFSKSVCPHFWNELDAWDSPNIRDRGVCPIPCHFAHLSLPRWSCVSRCCKQSVITHDSFPSQVTENNVFFPIVVLQDSHNLGH